MGKNRGKNCPREEFSLWRIVPGKNWLGKIVPLKNYPRENYPREELYGTKIMLASTCFGQFFLLVKNCLCEELCQGRNISKKSCIICDHVKNCLRKNWYEKMTQGRIIPGKNCTDLKSCLNLRVTDNSSQDNSSKDNSFRIQFFPGP